MPKHTEKNCEALANHVVDLFSEKDVRKMLASIIEENYLENEDSFNEACEDYNWEPNK